MRPRGGGARIRVRIALSLLAAAVALLGTTHAQQALLPVDEAAQQPDFFTFRAHLQRAIAARDTATLLAAVHPDIRNSFGDDGGIANFRKVWDPESAESRLWEELGTVLALGGRFQEAETFVAPYVFARWPEELDPFEHVAVIGARVRVRAAPKADAEVIDTVSYGVLRADPSRDVHPAWTPVRIGRRSGYVATPFVRSPIDYRAIFAKRDGAWRLVTFVAGD